MFTILARFTAKFRVIITLIWLIAAAGMFLFAPKLSEVGVTDESQFLPGDTESATAARLLCEKFTGVEETSEDSGLIVVYDENGLNDTDYQDARSIRDWLISDSAPKEIRQVTSIFDNEVLRARLVSPDEKAMMMVVDFSSGAMSDPTRAAAAQISNHLRQNYGDSNIYFTGAAGLFGEMLTSVEQTIDRTTLVTIILVVVLLLIIYRSPVAILLPLVAIGASYAVAVGLLGFLGQAGVNFSTLSEAYLVVIVFGVGTDYCLFIVSRFREELRKNEWKVARRLALERIGPVIAASALTVIIAFLALGISKFGLNQTTGYALAIGVGVTLLAGLTLVPALIALFGKWLFWPAGVAGASRTGSSIWQSVGRWVSRRPAVIAITITLLLLIPYLALPGLTRSADMVNQLPQDAASVRGYRVLTEHFPSGELSPLYVLVAAPGNDLTAPSSLQAIESLSRSLADAPEVARVDYYAAPADQVTGLSSQLRGLADALGTGSGIQQLVMLQTAGNALTNLALAYPGIVASPNFQQAGAGLGQAGALAEQLSTAPPERVPPLMGELRQAVTGAAGFLDALVREFRLETQTPFASYILSTYFSADRSVARVNLIPAGSLNSAGNVAQVTGIRDAVKQSVASTALAGSETYLGGEDAVSADIMLINDADFIRVVILVVAGILLVIILLLRSLLAPLYMVATVLLNYGTTMGIATWLFLDVMKQNSIIYIIPLLIFVVLVALGADYNIFLVSRIREEARHLPARQAVSRAVANTGGVITACGIILAGTFATLMTSPLEVVFQIGAAVSIGVLIDTFLVRALLVPALAALAGRWSWWPPGLYRKEVPAQTKNLIEDAAV